MGHPRQSAETRSLLLSPLYSLYLPGLLGGRADPAGGAGGHNKRIPVRASTRIDLDDLASVAL